MCGRILVAFAIVSFAPVFAKADPLYSTTDLGSSYCLLTNSAGSTYGVTNTTGTSTYDFQKSPVDYVSSPTVVLTPNHHELSYQFGITATNGANSVGYSYDYSPIVASGAGFLAPLFGGWTLLSGPSMVPSGMTYSNSFTFDPRVSNPDGVPSSFFSSNGMPTYVTTASPPPVSDFNVHGQAVGAMSDGSSLADLKQYAAFSGLNFASNPTVAGDPLNPNNLNFYVPPIPGVTLTNAFRIDDSGRILAEGDNGDTYLLNPITLGLPTQIPEPATFLVFGSILVSIGVRSRFPLYRRPTVRP